MKTVGQTKKKSEAIAKHSGAGVQLPLIYVNHSNPSATRLKLAQNGFQHFDFDGSL